MCIHVKAYSSLLRMHRQVLGLAGPPVRRLRVRQPVQARLPPVSRARRHHLQGGRQGATRKTAPFIGACGADTGLLTRPRSSVGRLVSMYGTLHACSHIL